MNCPSPGRYRLSTSGPVEVEEAAEEPQQPLVRGEQRRARAWNSQPSRRVCRHPVLASTRSGKARRSRVILLWTQTVRWARVPSGRRARAREWPMRGALQAKGLRFPVPVLAERIWPSAVPDPVPQTVPQRRACERSQPSRPPKPPRNSLLPGFSRLSCRNRHAPFLTIVNAPSQRVPRRGFRIR